MDELKSKVYILADSQNRILRCEGGYSMGNIQNIEDWILVDEGEGDKYNLCQSHYFAKSLYEDHGIPIYKLVEGEPVERTEAEIAEDIAALPESAPSVEEQLRAELEDADAALNELGVTVDG